MAHGGARKGAGRKPGKVSQAKRDIAEMAREYGEQALQTLVDVATDNTAPQSARVSASNSLLDRAYGKPPQSMDLSSSDNTMSPKSGIDLTKAPPELLQWIVDQNDKSDEDRSG